MKKEWMREFTPQLFFSLRDYSRNTFLSDLSAGIIVGIVALPLAIAFGIASGVSPEQGIITAVVAGFLISLLGGSRVQIGGPTGAFVVIVYGVVQQYGFSGLVIATVMAGVMLLLLGLFKLGKLIKFIPYPIIVGFTSGIAVTVFTTQIPDIFGLDMRGITVPGDFLGKWWAYLQAMDSISWASLGMCILSICIIVATPRLLPKMPGTLVAILLITTLVYFLRQYTGMTGVETIGDRYLISSQLPSASVPSITTDSIRQLFPVALTIALLGAIESLLSATVADGRMGGEKHNPNSELMAQGVANIITPLFGGIPATGAIARTMTNVNNGGRTPVAGLIHAVVLLVILVSLMPLAQYIPMACLAGVLVVVAYNMSEWRSFRGLMRNQRADVAVLLVTFFLTVLFDLTVAIEVGMLLAVVLFLKRINESASVSVIKEKLDLSGEAELTHDDEVLILPKGVEVYEIDGPFFFGLANKFDESMRSIGDRSLVRIIRMRKVPFIDSTGIHNLENLCRKSIGDGMRIVLSGVRPAVKEAIDRSSIPDIIGDENICNHISLALKRAEELIEERTGTMQIE